MKILKLMNKIVFRKFSKFSIFCRCYSDVRKHKTYDAIICGGGMVGSTLAASIGNRAIFNEHKFLFLDENNYKSIGAKTENIFSNRVSAISPASLKLLEKIGIVQEMIKLKRIQEIKRMQIWDFTSDAIITFTQPNPCDDIAYIIENDLIVDCLFKKIQQMPNIKYKFGEKIVSFHIPLGNSNELIDVIMENGDIFQTKLLIGSDGSQSDVRKACDIHSVGWTYNQNAIVATCKFCEPTDNNIAWQRFLKNGPIALLPLNEQYSSLIWTTSPDECKTLMSLDDHSFNDAINSAFWSKDSTNSYAQSLFENLNLVFKSANITNSPNERLILPTIIETTNRSFFPLGTNHATHYVRPKVVLIGDAAHRIHPLAGQGVNLGFGDVRILLQCLEKAVYNGNDINDYTYLLSYETQRQRRVLPTLGFIDFLNRLYSTDFKPIVLARTFGLTSVNNLLPLKNFFIQQASYKN